jgi:hypothetical protein
VRELDAAVGFRVAIQVADAKTTMNIDTVARHKVALTRAVARSSYTVFMAISWVGDRGEHFTPGL